MNCYITINDPAKDYLAQWTNITKCMLLRNINHLNSIFTKVQILL